MLASRIVEYTYTDNQLNNCQSRYVIYISKNHPKQDGCLSPLTMQLFESQKSIKRFLCHRDNRLLPPQMQLLRGVKGDTGLMGDGSWMGDLVKYMKRAVCL
ncbi:hypothetical protein CHARACLAT_026331 [Characodon lateralis]|uniref:Uncharacterized protein n=1 Tax=Characodon lateralis TaxID=208331 RepID=A0ABU7EX88_9TELE|nr:hypothetical protein [Characodon lateralis]